MGEGDDRPPASGVRWTDNHCHLDPRFDQAAPDTAVRYVDELVADARAQGVERLVTVGTRVDTSTVALEMARQHDGLFCTAGVHPHDARTAIGAGAVDRIELIEGLAAAPEVVAIGECGLDHHYDHSPRDQQRAVFEAQVALAHRVGLPLVVHTREAWDDTFTVLDAGGVPEGSVLHCFTGGPGEARKVLDLGMYLSFSGIVTFRSADDVRAAARLCPMDRLLVETDSPYLAPVPHRGRPNRPALLPVVGAALAEVKGVDVAAVAEATWQNATAAYRLP